MVQSTLEQALLTSRFDRMESAMGRVKHYRRSATECLALADCVSNPGDRALLVAMAARWHDLAERADKDAEPPAEPRPHPERRARFRVVSGSETPDLRSRRDAG